MTTRNKVILGVVALVVLGILIAKKLVGGNSSSGITQQSNSPNQSGSTSNSVITASIFPLSKAKRSGYNGGVEAEAVRQLQRWLNATAWRYGQISPDYTVGTHDVVVVDGKFGDKTENALQGALGSNNLSYTQYQTRRIYEY